MIRQLILSLMLITLGFGQTTLSAGDLAVIGLNADAPDKFAFVLLVDIEAGTEIRFTDSGVHTDGSFRPNEGAIKYTAPSAQSAGTYFEVDITSLPTDFVVDNDSGVGTNGMNLSASGDQIIAFQGASESPTYIFALQINSTEWQTDATGTTNSALPTGLVNGVSAVAAGAGAGSGDEYDNAVYNDTITSGTKSDLLAAIANNANWTGNNSAISYTFSNYTVLADGAPVALSFTSEPSASNIGITSADVSFETSDSTNFAALYYATDTLGVVDTVKFNDSAKSFSTTLSPLTSSTTYFIKAFASTNDTSITSAWSSFTTDEFRFVANASASGIGLDAATISFATTDSADIAILLYTTDTLSTVDTVKFNDKAVNFSTMLTGLSARSNYFFKTAATKGITNIASAWQEFQTDSIGFANSPELKFVREESAELSFTTSHPVNATIYLDDAATITILNTSSVDTILTGLTKATSYNLRYKLVEANGLDSLETTNEAFTTVDFATIPKTGVFISEYVEGSSSNKAAEIFNGSGQSIDLKDYVFMQFWNGNDESNVNANIFSIDTSHTLNDGDVVVIVNPNASSELLAKADFVASGSFNFVSFNGDDALALVPKYSFNSADYSQLEYIDIFGEIGVDPGSSWSNGDHSTANKTLRRKSTVTTGVNVNPSPFDPSVEWDVFDSNTFDGLGERNTLVFLSSPLASVESHDSISVSFTASENVTAKLYYGTTASLGDSITLASSSNFSTGLSGLAEQTQYYFQVKLTRESDGTSILSALDSATTFSEALSFASAPSVGSITDSTAVISFNSNILATASIYYGMGTFSDTLNVDSANSTFAESLNSLTAGADYIAQVRITKNGDSETVVSDMLNFTTTNFGSIVTTGLIFSEYVEGSSNNKALEIFNGTGATIDLSLVKIAKGTNGNSNFSSPITLSGTLENDSLYVLANPSSFDELKALADTLVDVATWFNGDDQLRLIYAGDSVDHIGVPGDVNFGSNVTLRRKASVTVGNLTYDENEWESFPSNTFYGLGERNSVVPLEFTASPMATVNGTDSMTIVFSASDSSSAKVMYGLTSNYTDTISLASASAFSVGIGGLSEATEYHFAVMLLRDSDGYTVTSQNDSVTTESAALLFSSAPSVGSLTDSSAVISFSANHSSTAAIYYGMGTFTDTVNVGAATEFSEMLSGLMAETAYMAQVRITKDGDSETVVSDTLMFTTEAEQAPLTGGLFFSEYVEGSSNNKALEIFNGTANTIDLSTVSIAKGSNGNSDFSSPLSLSGMLASGQTHVIGNPSASDDIKNASDTLMTVITWYNGDDQLRLFLNGNPVDHIGVPGDITFGGEVTLRRKSSVTFGNLTYDENEWESFPQNTFDGLGSHSVVSGDQFAFVSQPSVDSLTLTSAQISFSASKNANAVLRYGVTAAYTDSIELNTASMDFSYTLTSLTKNTTYHYNVTINEVDGDMRSATSADASFKTLDDAITPIDAIIDDFASYNGQTVNIIGVLLNDFGKLQSSRTNLYIAAPNGKAINVSSSTLYNSLMRGDSVQVSGSLSEYNSVYQIEPSAAPTVLKQNAMLPNPILATTAEVANITHHGNYIRVYAEVKSKSGNLGGGYNITVNDGSGDATVRVWVSTGIDIAGITVGQWYTFQGATSTFSSAGQLLPSVQEDIFQGFGFTSLPMAKMITDSSATIEFATNADASAVLRYGLTSYTDSISLNTASAFSVPLNGLMANTDYVFNVTITDSAAMSITSTQGTFKTKVSGSGGTIFPGLYGEALITALRDSFSMQADLGYTAAREHMFGTIDNYNDTVTLVYTGFQFHNPSGNIPDHNYINTEHTWPQSKGADGRRKYDIHHLFPTFNRVNGARGSYRFDELNDDTETDKWWISENAQTSKPSSNIDAYSESSNFAFEPREAQKGNTARAMMYFYAMYKNDGINLSWFNSSDHIETLRAWNQLDPVDARELERSGRVKAVQGNDNPFILDPTLVDRIFGETPSFIAFTQAAAVTAADTFATVSWQTNKPASGHIVYGTDTLNLDTMTVAETVTGNVRLENLMAETSYMAYVWLTDGNLAVMSDTLMFTTLEKDTTTGGGSTGGSLIISEVVDGPNSGGKPKYLELTNTGSEAIDLAGYIIHYYANGGTEPSRSDTLSSYSLPSGESLVYTNASDSEWAGYSLGSPSHIIYSAYAANNNGDDVYALADNSGALVDVYGEIGTDGTGEAWEFLDSHAYRKSSINSPNATFTLSEWEIAPINSLDGHTSDLANFITPGTHVALSGDEFVFVNAPSASGVQFTTANITFSASQNATAVVRYGLTASYTDSMTLSEAKSFTVELTGLSANTEYHFNVTVRETSGDMRVLTSADATFTTLNDAVTSISDIVSDFATYDGQTVTVEGVLLNDFGSLQATRTNIYIVAPDGRALNVSSSTLYSDLKRGDKVRVVGEISEFSGVYQIGPSVEPTVLSSGNAMPTPIPATTAEIANITYHGDYIEVYAEVEEVFATGTSGTNITINDGSGSAVVRVWSTTGIDLSHVEVGKSYYFRGATGSFSSAGQLLPSVAEDISEDKVIDVPTDRMAFAHQSFFYNPEHSLADEVRFNFALNRAIVGAPTVTVGSQALTVNNTSEESFFYVNFPITESGTITFNVRVVDSLTNRDTTLVSNELALAIADGASAQRVDITDEFSLQTHRGAASRFVANRVGEASHAEKTVVSDVFRVRASNKAASLDLIFNTSNVPYSAQKLSFYGLDVATGEWEKLPSYAQGNSLTTTLERYGDVVVMYDEAHVHVPSAFGISQNFPNPFNPSTTIKVQLDKSQHIVLQVFNVLGQRVKTLANGTFPASEISFLWNGTNEVGEKMPSGVYFYSIITRDQKLTRKMILMK